MKSKKKIAVIIPLLIVVIIGVVAAVKFWNGNGDDAIHISGNIELTEVKIAFKMAGRLEALMVDEGSRVEKDSIVARLDKAQVERQHEAARAALQASQAGLEQLRMAIAYQREITESRIELSQADLDSAQAQLNKLLAGARTQEIGQAKASVEEAQAQLKRAQGDWERAQALYKTNTISTAQYDQARTQYEAARALYERVKEQKALVVEGARKEDVAAARAQVAKANAGLRTAVAGRLDISRMEQQVDVQQAEIDRATAQVALIEAQLNDTVAVSPIDGVVLVKAAEVGEIMAPGTTVLTIGDMAHPWLRGYIAEQDLGHVKLGQKVDVTTDSYPEKKYIGVITYIASEAEFTPKQIQTREERVKLVYRIKIDIDNSQNELKLNMPADAVIDLQGRS